MKKTTLALILSLLIPFTTSATTTATWIIPTGSSTISPNKINGVNPKIGIGTNYPSKDFTVSNDDGFLFQSSFGNAFRFDPATNNLTLTGTDLYVDLGRTIDLNGGAGDTLYYATNGADGPQIEFLTGNLTRMVLDYHGHLGLQTHDLTPLFSIGGGDNVDTNNLFLIQGVSNTPIVHVVGDTGPGNGTTTIDADLSLTGAFEDSTGSSGSNGNILRSTGSATQWIPISALGSLGTTSPWIPGQITFVVDDGTISSAATTTLTASGALSLSQPISVIGSSPSALSCTNASSGVTGCLTGTDWDTFNNKQATIGVTWPITLSGATIGFNGLSTSTPAVVGNIPYFSGVNTFANIATGTVSSSGGITTTASRYVLNGALAVSCDVASALIPGCLSAADWATFNSKVSTTRTLTIAGTADQITSSAGAQDLSANRTWTLSLPNHVIFPFSFQVTNATTTNATTTGSAYFTGVSASSILRTDSTGKLSPVTIGTNLTFDGTTLNASGSGTVGSGTQGQFPFYNAAGTVLTATSSLFVSQTRNIGVGTTSPYAKLSVHGNNGDTNTTIFAVASSTVSATTTLFSVSNIGDVIISNLNDGTLPPFLTLMHDTASAAVADSVAEIFFKSRNTSGTIIPYSAIYTNILSATAGAESASMYFAVANGDGSGGVSQRVELTGSLNGIAIGDGSTGFAILRPSDLGVGMRLQTATSPTGTLTINKGANGNFWLLPNGTGAVGINTTNPQFKLETIASSGSGYFGITNSSTGDILTVDSSGNFGINDASPDYKLEVVRTAGNSYFGVTNSSDGDIFTIPASGNVGIGSTTPFAALSVGTTTQGPGTLPLFAVSTSTQATLFNILGSGRVGIGTTSPGFLLDSFSTATTTIRVDSNNATRGACLVLKDRDGSGYTYVTGNNGVLTASTNACN